MSSGTAAALFFVLGLAFIAVAPPVGIIMLLLAVAVMAGDS